MRAGGLFVTLGSRWQNAVRAACVASGRQRLPKGGELLAGWPAAGQGKVRGPPPDPGTRARAARSSSHNRDHPPHRSSSTPIGHFMAGLTNDDVLSTSRQASWSRGRWGVAQSVRQRAARLASGQGLEVWVGGRGRGREGAPHHWHPSS